MYIPSELFFCFGKTNLIVNAKANTNYVIQDFGLKIRYSKNYTNYRPAALLLESKLFISGRKIIERENLVCITNFYFRDEQDSIIYQKMKGILDQSCKPTGYFSFSNLEAEIEREHLSIDGWNLNSIFFKYPCMYVYNALRSYSFMFCFKNSKMYVAFLSPDFFISKLGNNALRTFYTNSFVAEEAELQFNEGSAKQKFIFKNTEPATKPTNIILKYFIEKTNDVIKEEK